MSTFMSAFVLVITLGVIFTVPSYLIALGILRLFKGWFGDGVHNFLRRTVNIVFSLFVFMILLGAFSSGYDAVKEEEEAAIREAKKKENDELIENVMSEADIVIFCPVPVVTRISRGDDNKDKNKGDLWGTKEWYLFPNEDDIEKSLLVEINTDNGHSFFSFDRIQEQSEKFLRFGGFGGFRISRIDLMLRGHFTSYSNFLSVNGDGETYNKIDGSTTVASQCEKINDPKNISKIIKEKEKEYKAEKEKRKFEKEKLEKNKLEEEKKQKQDVIDNRKF